jgi:LacI family sucrose operon transcriptional repressor
MANIREVAKKANVASCTVSRVLNGTANVAPETRARIDAAMKELNYIPNELARGMFRQQAGIIAMLVPNIRHPFFSSLATIVEEKLYEQGYKLMLCSTCESVEREKEYMKTLKTNIVDGVIMAVCNLQAEDYETFEKPIVMLDYKVNDTIPLVVSDHRMGGMLAAEQFAASGCHYILHICNVENMKNEKNIISFQSHVALEEELKKNGIAFRRVNIDWSTFDYSNYLKLATLILEQYPEVDGIMAADMPAIAFLKAAIKLGKLVPEDFCVVAYDGTFIAHINMMDVTIIEQNMKEYGNKIVEVIMKQLRGEPLEERDFRIPVKLIQGETTIPVK